MDADNGTTTVEIDTTGDYKGAPAKVEITLVIHGIPSGSLVAGIDGAKGKVAINKREGTATATFTLNPAKKAVVSLGLVPGPRLQRR